MLHLRTTRPAAALLPRSSPWTAHCQLSISAHAAPNNAKNCERQIHEGVDVSKLLGQPTWSVSSLLSASSNVTEPSDITLDKLRLFLRLSALSFPASPEEQAAQLRALRTQLHFVRDIQRFDTTGIPPLQAIRDETNSAARAQTIGVKNVEQILRREQLFGHNRRPRRRKVKADASETGVWDVLDTASQTAGRYVVVNDSKQ